MASVANQPQPTRATTTSQLPRLESGDHLDQQTFHSRYVAMPESVTAELIGGVVYMPASLGRPHGRYHGRIMHLLYTYEDETAGVEAYDNATTLMSDDSEPQPDACLIIQPQKGGQSSETAESYLLGAPELIVEVASSIESIDLHRKKQDYERVGVKEYMVVAIRQHRVFWFASRDGQFVEMARDEEGVYRSEVFPGLWLDAEALIALDGKRLMAALRRGIDSDDHTTFVKQLDGS